MKRICIILFCLFGSVQAQNLSNKNWRIIYELTYQIDSNDMKKKKEDSQLIVTKKSSLFQTINFSISDSIKFFNISRDNYIGSSIFHLSILKNYDEEQVFHYEGVLMYSSWLYYSEKVLNSNNWVLTPDTANIRGYHCQKATLEFGNRTWEAWFTAEIPIFEGSYKFSGLPGLIIKIYDKTLSWEFLLKDIVELENNVVINIDYLPTPTKIEKLNFYQQRKKNKRKSV